MEVSHAKEAGREGILSNLMVMDFLSFPPGPTTHVVDGDKSCGRDESVDATGGGASQSRIAMEKDSLV